MDLWEQEHLVKHLKSKSALAVDHHLEMLLLGGVVRSMRDGICSGATQLPSDGHLYQSGRSTAAGKASWKRRRDMKRTPSLRLSFFKQRFLENARSSQLCNLHVRF